jgi:hypothetical protein
MVPSASTAPQTSATNPNFVSVTATNASLDSISTGSISSNGWLQLKSTGPCYWLISGPGHLVTNQDAGCSIGTDNSGALGALNSPRYVRATNMVDGGYGVVQVSGSPSINGPKHPCLDAGRKRGSVAERPARARSAVHCAHLPGCTRRTRIHGALNGEGTE